MNRNSKNVQRQKETPISCAARCAGSNPVTLKSKTLYIMYKVLLLRAFIVHLNEFIINVILIQPGYMDKVCGIV